MLLEMLMYVVVYYILSGLLVYIYAVIKSWEFTGHWGFSIKDGFIAGIIRYPRWLLGWLEWVVTKWRTRN